MFSTITPFLSCDTMCSGRRLREFNAGDEVELVQRVLDGPPRFVQMKGVITCISKRVHSNLYSYVVDINDNELGGINLPFLSNDIIIQYRSWTDYFTKSLVIDVLEPNTSIHSSLVTLKNVGSLHSEPFISLKLSYPVLDSTTHTLLTTNAGFLVALSVHV